MELLKEGLTKSLYCRRLKYGTVYAVATNLSGEVDVFPTLQGAEHAYNESQVRERVKVESKGGDPEGGDEDVEEE